MNYIKIYVYFIFSVAGESKVTNYDSSFSWNNSELLNFQVNISATTIL